ncbi:hypothetical protein CAOG_05751 [Capsaspora owczarzaki ATCC 30864]|uniref:hypothetical protein n=1 Tax=Capsaspora owczarzaki (strain ATCC 30864) TaxID=595528 RepID=UPI000352065C|nr:hypothetical protein CAOG_05751 [Capsaspora owczarzaki ATCC 30864]|eukprot:XP_004346424.2 hypothetical protein CAOG_05751 [Capsaspora owczarzaki ATCC 30864]
MENSLNKQQIDDAGAEAVAEALKVSTLLILELETNQIGEGGARAIAEALKVNTPLTTLMLHQNQIGYAGALAIAEALEVNDTLIYLGLNANQIGAAGAQAIAEALKVNRGLIQLFLHENQIGDAGAQAIAEALKVNKTLWRLNLDKNRIGDAGAQAIAETLKVNKMLIELSLRWNCIGNRGSQALDEARKVNGFRELFSELQINPLVFSWLPRVATAEDLQTVFCLLTSGLELENQSASLPALPAEIADIIMEDAHYWQGVQHTRGNEFFEDKNHPPLSVTVPRDVTGSPIRMKAIQVIREMQFPDTTLGVCFELSVRDGRGVARYQCAVKPTRIDSSIGLVLLRPGSHPIFEQLREGWEVLLQPSVYGMQVGIESLTLAYI